MKKPNRKDANMSLKIEPELRQAIDNMAHRMDISSSEFVRQCIVAWMEINSLEGQAHRSMANYENQ